MATGREAVAAVAVAAGIAPVTVGHTARVLKEARADLWVSGGKGVRDAHVGLGHIVNLTLASAAGDPIHAVAVVTRYRDLRPVRIGVPGQSDAHCPGAMQWVTIALTLGETLEKLTEQYAAPAGEHWVPDIVQVVLHLDDHYPEARIEIVRTRDQRRSVAVFHAAADAPGPEPGTRTGGGIVRSAALLPEMFRAMAGLYRDTLARRKPPPSTHSKELPQ
jgi:hypothetical protein